ncbi:hypothetical protein [Nocardia sp. NPDC047654]|uniref:hypothetical protein n=1 Tax=Nocardia sp. NPDC047654 TaxID=3364314 RepID=UPI00371543D4
MDSDQTAQFRVEMFLGGYRDGHLDAAFTDGNADTSEWSIYHKLLSVANVQFPIAEKMKPKPMRKSFFREQSDRTIVQSRADG